MGAGVVVRPDVASNSTHWWPFVLYTNGTCRRAALRAYSRA
jgi:hypothetical protein